MNWLEELAINYEIVVGGGRGMGEEGGRGYRIVTPHHHRLTLTGGRCFNLLLAWDRGSSCWRHQWSWWLAGLLGRRRKQVCSLETRLEKKAWWPLHWFVFSRRETRRRRGVSLHNEGRERADAVTGGGGCLRERRLEVRQHPCASLSTQGAGRRWFGWRPWLESKRNREEPINTLAGAVERVWMFTSSRWSAG